jgi:hypothetical protein
MTNEFSMPKLPMPNMTDSLDFVRKIWGGMGMPPALTGAIAPTIDLDELDKRIADLRAVEQWMQVNLNMLRGTIQAMEVQRATVATLRSFGATLMGQESAGELASKAGTMMSAMATSASAPVKKVARRVVDTATSGATRAAVSAATQSMMPGGKREPVNPSEVGLSPGLWFNLLQDQFNKVATAAMTGKMHAPQPGPARKSPAARKPARSRKSGG